MNKTFGKWTAALACGYMLAAANATAQADDQNASVASDGSVPAMVESGGAKSGTVAPVKGTGPSPGLAAIQRYSPLLAGKRSPLPGAERGVIGADGRTRINNTAAYPNRAIAEITRVDTSGTWGCTGWFISDDTVATAGHCVHKGSGGSTGFYTPSTITVRPGRNGTSTPFGSCVARRLYTVAGWSNNGSENYDYGAIKLNCTVGAQTGYFGLAWTTGSLVNQSAKIIGYPCDKPSGTMWGMGGKITASSTYKVRYKIDTFGCQSGSPVFETRSAGPYSIAVHAYFDNGGATNSGTRITKNVFNNFLKWRVAP